MKYVALTMSRGDSSRLKDWLEYHCQIGFDEFYIFLDNPIDDSENIISDFSRNFDVEVHVEILPPCGEYFDGLSGEERWEKVKQWRLENSDKIKRTGLPIVDPLSFRQYDNIPRILSSYSKCGQDGWLALFDVDEYIVIQDGGSIPELIDSIDSPRIRLLNFNFDMREWDKESSVRDKKFRWSRDNIQSFGNEWQNRFKSIVRFDCLVPLVSVHGISKGKFFVVDHNIARLHHYKFPDQNLPIPYSIFDDTI
jgi:hypothetical protein